VIIRKYKKQNRMKKYLFVFLSVSFLLTGCINDDIVGHDEHSLSIGSLSIGSVSMDGLITRASSPLATEGDTISVSALTSLGAVSATSQYTYTSGAWGKTSSCSNLIVPVDSYVCAYYPYSARIKDIKVDMSIIGLKSVKYDSSKDLSYGYAKVTGDASASTTHANLEMKHAYARLTFKFHSLKNYSIDSISISNPNISDSANIDITKSPAIYSSPQGSSVTFVAGITVTSSTTPTTSVLVVPTIPSIIPPSTTVSTTLTDEFLYICFKVIDINKVASYKLLSLPVTLFAKSKLEAGNNYQIGISIDKSGNLTLASNGVKTTDWVTGTPTNNTLTCLDESNCYIVAPNSGSIKIPVSRANTEALSRGAAFPLELGVTNFSAGVLWSDVSGLITSVTPDVANGTITITPNSSSIEGNAVVYAKVGTDIVWSWHIWVTNYDPSTTTMSYNTRVWMDRNLGAKTNGTESTAYGMYYQWGRKDPFPQGVVTGAIAGTGNFLNIGSQATIATTITTPMTFYYGSSDWNSSPDNYLWNAADDTKTIYDPCPDGWRVPASKTYFSGTFSDNTYYLNKDGIVNGLYRAYGFSVRCVKN
jgi:hypothetical protein